MLKVLRATKSVCPVCLVQVSASVVHNGTDTYLRGSCRDHGPFSSIIWRWENPSINEWCGNQPLEYKNISPDCPNSCGLCPSHVRDTCCILVEVTNRCDQNCRFCFAGRGSAVDGEPDLETLRGIFLELAGKGRDFVQLSGGEPCMRDDLPDIIASAVDSGCKTIQLNTNGLRISAEPSFAERLARAGLSFVFLQFDGTREEIYRSLRGRDVLREKLKAIEICGELGLGVTLVPTIVPGINDDNIGEILNFAIGKSPIVRGVHFQPVCFTGLYPAPPSDSERITLPEILYCIEEQTNGMISISDLAPGCCDHPRCGFHGDFIVLQDGRLMSFTKKVSGESCCLPKKNEALRNREFIARRWMRNIGLESNTVPADLTNMEAFLSVKKSRAFTVTAMAFQDRYSLDLERLRRCSLHVYDNGRIVPFCARYINAEQK